MSRKCAPLSSSGFGGIFGMSWGALYLYASSIRSEWGLGFQKVFSIGGKTKLFIERQSATQRDSSLGPIFSHGWSVTTPGTSFHQPVQVAQAEVLLTRIWGFQSLTWETNILKVWHLFFLYKSFWKQCSTIQGRGMRTKGCDLFLSFALLPASNMLGRWSIDGVFTMRRIPREHQVRFRVWAQGPKYDSPLIGIETLCSVIYVTRRQPCKDRPILENSMIWLITFRWSLQLQEWAQKKQIEAIKTFFATILVALVFVLVMYLAGYSPP